MHPEGHALQKAFDKKLVLRRRWQAWVAHVALATCSSHAGFNEWPSVGIDETQIACLTFSSGLVIYLGSPRLWVE
jgi:hypothetical protein